MQSRHAQQPCRCKAQPRTNLCTKCHDVLPALRNAALDFQHLTLQSHPQSTLAKGTPLGIANRVHPVGMLIHNTKHANVWQQVCAPRGCSLGIYVRFGRCSLTEVGLYCEGWFSGRLKQAFKLVVGVVGESVCCQEEWAHGRPAVPDQAAADPAGADRALRGRFQPRGEGPGFLAHAQPLAPHSCRSTHLPTLQFTALKRGGQMPKCFLTNAANDSILQVWWGLRRTMRAASSSRVGMSS